MLELGINANKSASLELQEVNVLSEINIKFPSNSLGTNTVRGREGGNIFFFYIFS